MLFFRFNFFRESFFFWLLSHVSFGTILLGFSVLTGEGHAEFRDLTATVGTRKGIWDLQQVILFDYLPVSLFHVPTSPNLDPHNAIPIEGIPPLSFLHFGVRVTVFQKCPWQSATAQSAWLEADLEL